MAFPPRFLEELRARVSISELVGRRVRLQKKGREHLGLCPFHNEKTPSFTVSDEKGFYHCFGCGAHGDVISFLTETEKLSFPEAVEQLAGLAGLEVPRSSAAEIEKEKRDAGLHACIEAACAFFERQLRLPEGKAALDYLRGRGLDDAAIRRFRIGYAPDRRGALVADLSREGFVAETLIEAGLLKESEHGSGPYEYFRGRISFPITDRRGRVIAFGGRTLGDQQPKYLNSPESPVFHKGRILYGLAQARERVRETGELVVVEGYMDVIALDRPGLPGAVAPLGTALTEDQIRELWRLAPEPVLCLDGDEAGRRAAMRAAERALPLLQPGRSLRFAMLPAGEDPDSLIRNKVEAALSSAIAAGLPLGEVIWRMEVARIRPDTPERRADLQRRLQDRAASIRDGNVRENYVTYFGDRFAERFGGPRRGQRPDRFGRGHEQGQARRWSGPGAREQRPRPRPSDRSHNEALFWLVGHPGLIGEFSELLANLELSPELDSLRAEILNVSASRSALDATELETHLGHNGYGAALHALRSPLTHLRWTNREEESVRRRLNSIVDQIERRRIDIEAKSIPDDFGTIDSDQLVRRSAMEMERRAREDDGLF